MDETKAAAKDKAMGERKTARVEKKKERYEASKRYERKGTSEARAARWERQSMSPREKRKAFIAKRMKRKEARQEKRKSKGLT